MSVNKVQLANGETIIDISDSTVTPETLAEGVVAYNAKGERIAGTHIGTEDAKDIGTKILNGSITSIVLLGDSITDGAGGSDYSGSYSGNPSTNSEGYCWANAFKKFVEERYGIQVVNKGMYGTQMSAQKNMALEYLTENDFVIWLTGTNDRNSHSNYQANLRNYLAAVKEKCAGMLVISNIPATKADEDEHVVTMQKMDEIITAEASGYVPHFSMYQAFTAYCELHDIQLSDCFADHVHPNDLGYSIMFRLLCQKLGLPLDPYMDYGYGQRWWPGDRYNLFSGVAFKHGYINYITGEFIAFGFTYGISEEEYIPIQPGKTYTLHVSGVETTSAEKPRASVKFYTQDKTYTGQYIDDSNAFAPYTFTAPEDIGVAYMRASFVIGASNTITADWSNAVYVMKEERGTSVFADHTMVCNADMQSDLSFAVNTEIPAGTITSVKINSKADGTYRLYFATKDNTNYTVTKVVELSVEKGGNYFSTNIDIDEPCYLIITGEMARFLFKSGITDYVPLTSLGTRPNSPLNVNDALSIGSEQKYCYVGVWLGMKE